MIIFKILLIILVAAPAVGLGVFLFMRVNAFVRNRNGREMEKLRERMRL